MIPYNRAARFGPLGPLTRTRKEHYGFAVDVCFVTAYNSKPETLASPIIGFNVGYDAATDKLGLVVNNVGQ